MTACLIVDDEIDIRTLIALALKREGVACHLAADLAQARQLLAEHGAGLSFCLTDMRLPDGDGLDLLDEIRTRWPNLPVAVITAHGQVDAAVRALKAGAFDFVSKPIEHAVLKRLVRDAQNLSTPSANSLAEPTPTAARPRIADKTTPEPDSPLIGQSTAMHTLRSTIEKLARSQAPIFVCGESGTGKELVAREIHQRSARAKGPFVAVNCGAIPAELIESELFGHKKGAFTGAHQSHEGLFRAAEGGVLFLDEVADLPLGLQVKLLRAIQERKVRPVGESAEVPIDVRIISASHQDLNQAVAEGKFRQDLFFRLNVIELRVPALRARLDDLPLLCRHILGKLCLREQRPVPTLSADALAWLSQQPFPGNVRELENRLERALALTDHAEITLTELDGDALTSPGTTSLFSPTHTLNPVSDPAEAEEQRQVLNALAQTRWNRSEAARSLGLTLRQLRYRLSKWGIE